MIRIRPQIVRHLVADAEGIVNVAVHQRHTRAVARAQGRQLNIPGRPRAPRVAAAGGPIGRAAARLDRLIYDTLFEERRETRRSRCGAVVAGRCGGPGAVCAALLWRKHLPHSLVVVQGEADLPQVIETLRAPRGFAGGLNGWQQQGNQDADDGDYDEQLDQREAGSFTRNESHDGTQRRRRGKKAGWQPSVGACVEAACL